MDLLKNSDPYCSPDPYGRRHHNLTSYKRELKSGLYVPGLELVEVDVSNSQPFLLNTLLNHNSTDAKEYLNLTSHGLFWKTFKDDCIYTGDMEQFKKDTFHAVFYSHPRSQFQKDGIPLDNHSTLTGIRDVFKKQFPGVYNQIIGFKKSNYKNLAREMQRKESDLIIDTVCNHMRKEAEFFIPIHDSIICDIEASENVMYEIKSAFRLKYGIVPTLKLKNYDTL